MEGLNGTLPFPGLTSARNPSTWLRAQRNPLYLPSLKAGIKQESLDANAEIKKVDMVRSKRLNEEFNSKH